MRISEFLRAVEAGRYKSDKVTLTVLDQLDSDAPVTELTSEQTLEGSCEVIRWLRRVPYVIGFRVVIGNETVEVE